LPRSPFSPHGETRHRLVPAREEEALPRLVSPTDRAGNQGSSLFSPFSYSPSSSFSLNRPPTVEIDRRRLISMVLPNSGRSTYQYPIGLVRTAHIGRYRPKRRTLPGTQCYELHELN
ncbi:hypothetical protein BHM03_00031394, partial [Ensete ventricosum]